MEAGCSTVNSDRYLPVSPKLAKKSAAVAKVQLHEIMLMAKKRVSITKAPDNSWSFVDRSAIRT